MYLKELSSTRISQRDRIYIVKDLILKLVEYGALNQTALISFCGLNLKKHRDILEEMEENGLIVRTKVMMHKKTVTIYRPTVNGIEFCREILEPYEKMFPRSKRSEAVVR
jgi:predicted transcriptional regulator